MTANVESMMYYKEKPWHGLGNELDNPATSSEAIIAAGMDWEVEAQNIVTESGILLPKKKAIIRKDNNVPLGVVGLKFQFLQNKESFSFFDGVVGQSKAIYHTAGVIGKGEKIWILAKLPKNMYIAKDDEVEEYLLLVNSHDGKGSIRMFFTPIRVVCQNTLNIALSDGIKQGASIRHVGKIMDKITDVQEILRMSHKFYTDFEQGSKFLASKQVNSKEVEKFIKTCFSDYDTEAKKVKNMMEKVEENFETEGKVLPTIAGTYWALFNGYTGYIDHGRATKGKDEYDRKSNHLNSIWFDSSVKLKQRAWDAAVNIASK